jgi:hypothetical protein
VTQTFRSGLYPHDGHSATFKVMILPRGTHGLVVYHFVATIYQEHPYRKHMFRYIISVERYIRVNFTICKWKVYINKTDIISLNVKSFT